MFGAILNTLAITAYFVAGVAIIHRYKDKLPTNVVNIGFACATFFPYLFSLIDIYYKCGVNDWNFVNALPTGNVSPFMFCSVMIIVFLPRRIRRFPLTLISLLSLGMFVAAEAESIEAIVRTRYYLALSLDASSHVTLSLFGIYLYASEQVDADFKTNLIGGAIIVVAALIMAALNAILGTAFFGMSFRGEQNIYHFIYIKDPYVSTFGVYMPGLLCVLIGGYAFQQAIARAYNKKTMEIPIEPPSLDE